jgi:hypothetical protein
MVTDSCGVADETQIRNTGGDWVFLEKVWANTWGGCTSYTCDMGYCGNGWPYLSPSPYIIDGPMKWIFDVPNYCHKSCMNTSTWRSGSYPPPCLPENCPSVAEGNIENTCDQSVNPDCDKCVSDRYYAYEWNCP